MVKARSVYLIIIVIIFHFFVFEALTRWELFGAIGFSPSKLESMRGETRIGILPLMSSEYCTDELMFMPNKDLIYEGVRFQTNRFGLRDKNVKLKKPEGTFRILVVGNCEVLGFGVKEEDIFHSILERRLNDEFEDIEFEIINFGYLANDWECKIKLIERLGIYLRPDLILFFTEENVFNWTISKQKMLYKKYRVPIVSFDTVYGLERDQVIDEGVYFWDFNKEVFDWNQNYPMDPHHDSDIHMKLSEEFYDKFMEYYPKLKEYKKKRYPKGRPEKIKKTAHPVMDPTFPFWKSYYIERITERIFPKPESDK